MKDLSKLSKKQSKVVLKGQDPKNNHYGNVDDLINEDGWCNICEWQLKVVSKGRGSDDFWGNVDDLINKYGSCKTEGMLFFAASIQRGREKLNINIDDLIKLR